MVPVGLVLVLSMWYCFCRQAECKNCSVIEDSIRISNEGLGGQEMCDRVRIPFRQLLRRQCVKLWEWNLNCNRIPKLLERPGMRNVCQGQQQIMNGVSHKRGEMSCRGQGHRADYTSQLELMSYFHIVSQVQTWSYRIQCLPCWILVFLWSNTSLLLSYSSLLEWKCLFCITVC
jgi:hypothetical protein